MSSHPSSLEVAPPRFWGSDNSKKSAWTPSPTAIFKKSIHPKLRISFEMKSWYDFMWPPFQPPWDNLRGKFTTAALCDSGRIWLKNWGQMAVRCRHGEWVAVKWQRGQFTLLLCKFSTLDSIKTIHMIHSTQLIFWTMKTLFKRWHSMSGVSRSLW